jgi:hypothetical protein
MIGGAPAHMQQHLGGASHQFDSPRHALHDELNNMVNGKHWCPKGQRLFYVCFHSKTSLQ